ncbi:transcription factor PIL1 isoform X2 [Raphanus sativus]|uniref:Transcription factor PIL1 isoform X2 n=1 Tax=Raphanus sativus TaxID=3726 RepID=A0A9W3BYT0_RAPSA|nr:transcription factor PIL1 isoform X2 [Raphanus sativus]
MISPSSSFKPTRLNDQDYMELVCENGQILAKSRKTNNNGYFQNKRTQSILDLYETEYDESFKKNIKNLEETQVVPVSDEHTNNKKRTRSSKNELERDLLKGNKRFESPTLNDGSLKGLQNVEAITTPDEQSTAVGRSTKLYFKPSSILSRGTSRDLSCSLKKRKHGDNEEEETTYLSNSSDDESDDAKTRVPARTRKTMAKRKRSTEIHKLSERKRRHEISKKMRALQDLLPNCYKNDKVSLLDEAIKYMRTLRLQVQMMSMGNGVIQPSMMLPMGNYFPMGLGMHMGAATTTTSAPQFMPMNVQGTAFHGINNASSHMLSAFLNHPTGLIPDSPIFSPLESCSQHLVAPSCFPETQATSLSQFPMSASTSNFEDAMQFRGSSGY